MGFFFQGYTFSTVFGVILLIAVLIGLNELTRISKRASVISYIVTPVILLVLLGLGVVGSPSSKTWFGIVKALSALAGVLGFMAIRFTKAEKTKFAVIFPVAILGINILEAVIKEFEVFAQYQIPAVDAAGLYQQGGIWNILNGISGIIVIVTMTGYVGIKVARTKSRDMIWADQLWFWIVAYDLWNIAYVYNCISNRSMYAGVVLIVACTLIEFFIRRGAWLQHRAQTLAIFAFFSICVDYTSLPMFQIESTNNPTAMMWLSVITFIFCICTLVYMIYRAIKTKRNPYTQELYVDLKEYKENLAANNL